MVFRKQIYIDSSNIIHVWVAAVVGDRGNMMVAGHTLHALRGTYPDHSISVGISSQIKGSSVGKDLAIFN